MLKIMKIIKNMNTKINKVIFISALSLFFVTCAQEPLKEESKEKSPKKPAPVSIGTQKSSEASLSPIKILSIDGGGIRGIIPAHLLAGFEKETGKRVYELFDIIAGTSTGGLIALIVTTPSDANKTTSFMPAEEIEKFYIKYADKIFDYSCNSLVLKSLCGLAGPLYKVEAFEKLMKDIIGDRLFKEALKPTIIATFDIERKQGYSLESDASLFDNLTKADVARATTAAPTYFAPKILEMKNAEGGLSQHYMVDGGLYKNNPSLLAYRKAIKIFGADQVKKRGIVLISLGTGWPILNAHDGKDLVTAGFAKWAPAAIDAIIDGSSNEDHGFLEDLFHSRPLSTYIRIQALLDNVNHPAITELDNIDPNNLRNLVGAAKNIKNTPAYKDAVNILKKLSGPGKF